MKKYYFMIISIIILMPAIGISQLIHKNDSIITDALSRINKDSVEYQLQWLEDMETRFMMAPNHKQVSSKIKARFESFGITDVALDSFQCYTNINYGILNYDTTTWQYNVEAKIQGSLYPEEEIIIMGHHDNVQLDSNPEIYAPGADDNASGTVAALETARVLMEMNYQPERTLIFLTTAAEELMYFGDAGSRHYAYAAADSARNIWGVINNDMIAYDNGSNTISLSNVIGSEEITGVAEMITNTYTELIPMVDNPNPNSGADLQPFIEAGYRGVYLMERLFNPYYHTEFDLVENCDIDYLTEAIKISCGTVLYSDITVGVEEDYQLTDYISVFPNPASEYIGFKGNTKDWEEFQLSTLSGTVIMNMKFDNQIDISHLAPGFYIALMRSKSGNICTEKLIIR